MQATVKGLRSSKTVWAILVVLAAGLFLCIVDVGIHLQPKPHHGVIDQQFQYLDLSVISLTNGLVEHTSMSRAGSAVSVTIASTHGTRNGNLGLGEWTSLWAALQQSGAFTLKDNRVSTSDVEYRFEFGDYEAALWHIVFVDGRALTSNSCYTVVYDLVKETIGRVIWQGTATQKTAKDRTPSGDASRHSPDDLTR